MNNLFPDLWSVFLIASLTLPFLLFSLVLAYTFSLVTRAYDEIARIHQKGEKSKISRDTFEDFYYHTITLTFSLALYSFFSFTSGCFVSHINLWWPKRITYTVALAQFLTVLTFLLVRYRPKRDGDERSTTRWIFIKSFFWLSLLILVIWLCFSLFLTILCVRGHHGFLSLSSSFDPLPMLENFPLQIHKLADLLPFDDFAPFLVITLSTGLLVLCLVRKYLDKNSGKKVRYWLLWLIALVVFAGMVGGFFGTIKLQDILSLHKHSGTTSLVLCLIIFALAIVGMECWKRHNKRTMPFTTALAFLVCLYSSTFTTALILNEKRIGYMLVTLATQLALFAVWLVYVRHIRPVEKILSLIRQRIDSDKLSQGKSS